MYRTHFFRKKLINDGRDATKELASAMEKLLSVISYRSIILVSLSILNSLSQKARQAYERQCKETDGVIDGYLQAKNGGQIKEKDVKKLQQKSKQYIDKADTADKAYKTALTKANSTQTSYYEQKMPHIMTVTIFSYLQEFPAYLLSTVFRGVREVQNLVYKVHL